MNQASPIQLVHLPNQLKHWDSTCHVSLHDPKAATIYLVSAGFQNLDTATLAAQLSANLVVLSIKDWDNDLTPWPAPGLYPDDVPFKGNADHSLHELTDCIIPALEQQFCLASTQRALAGYSLGGLFSLYGFIRLLAGDTLRGEPNATPSAPNNAPYFDSVASLSSSVWYEGWPAFLQDTTFAGTDTFAYFSLGKKEKNAPPAILGCVEDRTHLTAEFLANRGVKTAFVMEPGNHFQHVFERITRGLRVLDEFYLQA